MLRDFRLAFRSLGTSPGLTVVALISLALGIGANTAIFSLLNAILLRTLPVPQAEQLVALSTSVADDVNGDQGFTWTLFDELSRRSEGFAEVFSWNGGGMDNFEADGVHYSASVATISANGYAAIQVKPLLGRYIASADVATHSGTSNAIAVISYRAWHHWFHGDGHVLGRVIRVGVHPFTVIGVEPEGYTGLVIDAVSDITIPLFAPGTNDPRTPYQLQYSVFARLRPGVSLAQATAAVRSLWPHILEASLPSDYSGDARARFSARKIKLESAATGTSFLRNRFSYSLKILMAIAGAVLLIACLNIANLSLAKAAAKRQQSAVQAALGAGSWELLRPALVESLMLACGGAFLGMMLAFWASRALLRIAWTGYVETSLNASPDLRVLGFTAVVTLLTGVLFGVAPALYAARTDPMDALKRQSRSVSGAGSALAKMLIVMQIALSLVLLVAALLFGRTLSAFRNADVGYRRDHILTAQLFPQTGSMEDKGTPAYYQQLAEKVRGIPGVDSVSYSFNGPGGEYQDLGPVATSESESAVQAANETVAPGFFSLVGMRFLAGRDVRWSDIGHNVAIVSRSLAEHLFSHANPVGRSVYVGPPGHTRKLTIIGVVNSASLWKVQSIKPMGIYAQFEPRPGWDEPLMDIRTSIDPQMLKTVIEQAIRSLGHQYSLRTVTVDERLNSRITVQQLTALLSEFFGGVALLIAGVGLYGLISFHVTRRSGGLGIRSALGAQRRHLLALVIREALVLAAAGCGLGIVATLVTGRFIQSVLFGVKAGDPKFLTASVITMFVLAFMAAFLPARRAACVDPMTALRAE